MHLIASSNQSFEVISAGRSHFRSGIYSQSVLSLSTPRHPPQLIRPHCTSHQTGSGIASQSDAKEAHQDNLGQPITADAYHSGWKPPPPPPSPTFSSPPLNKHVSCQVQAITALQLHVQFAGHNRVIHAAAAVACRVEGSLQTHVTHVILLHARWRLCSSRTQA